MHFCYVEKPERAETRNVSPRDTVNNVCNSATFNRNFFSTDDQLLENEQDKTVIAARVNKEVSDYQKLILDNHDDFG